MFAGQARRQLGNHAAHVVVVGAGQLREIGRERRRDEGALAGGVHVQAVLGVQVSTNFLVQVAPDVAQRRIGVATAGDVGIELVEAERGADALRVLALLAQGADVVDFGARCRLLHAQRQLVAVVVEHARHGLHQAGRRFVAKAGEHRLAVVVVQAAKERPFRRFSKGELTEEALEGLVETRLLGARLGEAESQRVLQQQRIADAELLDDGESIQRLGRRHLHLGMAQRRDEPGERDVHARPQAATSRSSGRSSSRQSMSPSVARFSKSSTPISSNFGRTRSVSRPMRLRLGMMRA